MSKIVDQYFPPTLRDATWGVIGAVLYKFGVEPYAMNWKRRQDEKKRVEEEGKNKRLCECLAQTLKEVLSQYQKQPNRRGDEVA